MTIKFSDITGGGIPYGNNAGRPANPGIGKLYSNGEAQRLELYTAQGWNNIVQETPGVSSISGNYSEATNSGVITITGTNFVSGCYATAIGTNGVQVDAISTTFNSIVNIVANFTGLSNQYEPYDIKVTNPSNLFGIIPDALYINASPVWQTASGSLGTFTEQVSINLSALSATDSDSTITYNLASGSSLPSGVTLNSSTGVISGTLPDVTTDTTYTFTVNASDGVNTIPRTFNINSVARIPIEYLIVGGGGAGSNRIAGGGGAGGMLSGTFSYSKLLDTISLSVGQGGAAFSDNNTGGAGSNGQNSTLFGLTAFGGGTGGYYSEVPGGSGGGSGGGGGGLSTGSVSGLAGTPGSGTSGQGNNGGYGAEYGGGGGGGAGGAGQQGNKGGTRYDSGGNGGIGVASSITGTSTHYAGGGGGGQRDLSAPARTNIWQIRGDGGLGGGGHGSGYTGDNMTGGAYATPGAPNTGGGGGGGAHSGTAGGGFVGDFRGAAGGSGVVVLAYPNTFPAPTAISNGLTYDTPTRSGYRVYRFTAGSGTVTF